MKKIILLGLVAMLVLGVAGYVYAAASAKIGANGPHDMAAKVADVTTDNPCIYCHTPHNATTKVGSPLQNRAAGVGASVYCMSCHDGTTAVGGASIFNQPLSGNLDGTVITAGPAVLNIADHTITGTGHVAGGVAINWSTDPKTVLVVSAAAAATNLSDTAKGARKTVVAGDLATIECQGCHDVHNHNADTLPFLRINMISSNLCVACHDL